MDVDAVVKPYPSVAPNPPPAVQGAMETALKDASDQVQKPVESAKAHADAAVSAVEPARVDQERLKAVLDKLNIVLNALDIQMKFSIHEATGQVMVRVINVESGKVIREIPPEQILDMAAKMMELVGVLLDERA